MNIVINAWLERKDPQIRILDGDNASLLMQCGPELTRRLLERGEVCIEDLHSRLDADLDTFILRMLGVDA